MNAKTYCRMFATLLDYYLRYLQLKYGFIAFPQALYYKANVTSEAQQRNTTHTAILAGHTFPFSIFVGVLKHGLDASEFFSSFLSGNEGRLTPVMLVCLGRPTCSYSCIYCKYCKTPCSSSKGLTMGYVGATTFLLTKSCFVIVLHHPK